MGRRWLLIDVDPCRPAKVSATDDELNAAWDSAEAIDGYLVDELGWPEPVLATSGNGGHSLYRIDMPNDDETAELVKRCLQALDLRFSTDTVNVDTTVYNASRIVKLYGTFARKGQDTPDRPHRLAKISQTPDPIGVATREQLRQLADQAPAPPPKASKPRAERGLAGFDSVHVDVDSYLAEHGIDVLHSAPYGHRRFHCGRLGGFGESACRPTIGSGRDWPTP